jgi:thiamine-phosphate diphosphorylase
VDPLALGRQYLEGGARFLQLRMKQDTGGAFAELGERLVAAARESGASVVVNDRVDIALMCGASGVHVGQDDLPVADVRRLAGPHRIVGLSTHDARQVDAALALPIDYLAVGPIFATGTKQTGYGPRGLDLVRTAAGRGRPVVAIGGITLRTATQVIDAGATAVAVISDLMGEDPAERIREYLRALA